MRKSAITLIISFLYFLIPSISAQDWRFPDCNDLSVSSIELNENSDTLKIKIFNDCDTCYQHVYTGLIVFSQEDTVAIDYNLYSFPTPDNKEEMEYFLYPGGNFEIKKISRIEMAGGICESISIDNVLTVLERENESSFYVRIYPNPVQDDLNYYFSDDMDIISLRILNHEGRIIEILKPSINKFNVSEYPAGIYLFVVEVDRRILSKTFIVN